MECLIEATTDAGDVVVDVLASTSASVRACRNIGRNIVALEEDYEIYKQPLEPLMNKVLPRPPESQPLDLMPDRASNYDSD